MLCYNNANYNNNIQYFNILAYDFMSWHLKKDTSSVVKKSLLFDISKLHQVEHFILH
jgi:hypothetical protein